eukprot:TRINITY_DN4865_c0_g1_i2.p1 TRINITY_DN4865_c0_g1~~TRINITY_DN4865_c0_g1_i2.p1  ORF type:complete len:783 (+),score=217.54 TRINITY_DN4865_c0_g1_i2:57-2405(+)
MSFAKCARWWEAFGVGAGECAQLPVLAADGALACGLRDLDMLRRHANAITAACERRSCDPKLNVASQLMGSEQVSTPFLAYHSELLAVNELTPLTLALQAYGEAQQQLLELRQQFETSVRDTFCRPAEELVAGDVAHARETVADYVSSKKLFEAARTRLLDAQSQAKIDATKLIAAQQDAVSLQADMEEAQTQMLWELEDYRYQKDSQFLNLVRELMLRQREYHINCARQFEFLSPMLITLQTESEKARKAGEENKKARQAAREAAQRKKKSERFYPLVMILAHPKLTLINAMNDVLEDERLADAFTTSVVRTLDSTFLLMPLILTDIQRQVAEMTDPSLMFRANSAATKLMTSYTKVAANQYIVDTLAQPINFIVENIDIMDYEIDPTRLEVAIDVEQNAGHLSKLCKMFVDRIMASDCPLPLRALAKHLRDEVGQKFGATAGLTAVGGFVFLRFICPNLIAPTRLGITEAAPSPGALRVLLLVTKVLQSLANRTKEEKEGYMKVMTPFLTDYQDALFNWFEELTSLPFSVCDKHESIASQHDVEEVDLPSILSLLRLHFRKLVKFLTADDKPTLLALAGVLTSVEFFLTRDREAQPLQQLSLEEPPLSPPVSAAIATPAVVPRALSPLPASFGASSLTPPSDGFSTTPESSSESSSPPGGSPHGHVVSQRPQRAPPKPNTIAPQTPSPIHTASPAATTTATPAAASAPPVAAASGARSVSPQSSEEPSRPQPLLRMDPQLGALQQCTVCGEFVVPRRFCTNCGARQKIFVKHETTTQPTT